MSNDELLEILAQTRNPLAVQPHLRKCFDAIAKLDFGIAEGSGEDGEPVQYTTDILSMVSPEAEKVSLGKGLKARGKLPYCSSCSLSTESTLHHRVVCAGNVEDWLCKVEEAMFVNLRKLTKLAIGDFEKKPRTEWVIQHASQIGRAHV